MPLSFELLPDAGLASRIAELPGGDAGCEAELCRRLAPRVRLYALRHLRDEQAAADLTQQVLLILLEALRDGRLQNPDQLASFTFGICRATLVDLRRKDVRRRELLARFAHCLPAATPGPLPLPDAPRLHRCLESLPEREKSVTILSFYDEQTITEVAGALGLTPNHVSVVRHRALARLRRCMTERLPQ